MRLGHPVGCHRHVSLHFKLKLLKHTAMWLRSEREESNLHLDRIRVACSPFYYVPTGGEDENLSSCLLGCSQPPFH